MLLTLAANSLRARLSPAVARGKPSTPRRGSTGAGHGTGTAVKDSDAKLALTDLPRFVHETFGLRGLNLSTDLLAGADARRLDSIREAADKASCPCLVLVETTPQPLADAETGKADEAIDRLQRVIRAANRLGCSSAAVTVDAPDDDEALDIAADSARRVLSLGERLEVNLLLTAGPGLCEQPDRLTELVKKIGGFRIGTFPDFLTAARAPDPLLYLRRLVPYASALTVSTESFEPSKDGLGFSHTDYDLAAFAGVVQAVGYSGTLAIDYRGDGDPVEGVRMTQTLLETALGLVEPADEADDLDDEEAGAVGEMTDDEEDDGE